MKELTRSNELISELVAAAEQSLERGLHLLDLIQLHCEVCTQEKNCNPCMKQRVLFLMDDITNVKEKAGLIKRER